MFVRPNILRTLRRTMIRFLIELLVRPIWFGQSKLYFILNWLVMRCKLRPELAADAQQTAWSKMYAKVKSVYFNHPSQGNSTNYYLILGLRDKAAPSTSQQINKFPPKRVKNLATPSSIFIFVFSSFTGELCSQPIRGNDRPTARMFPEHVERRFLDPEYSFAEYFQLGSRRNIRPIKNGLKHLSAILCWCLGGLGAAKTSVCHPCKAKRQ